jgi:hypothetical protein
MLSRPPIFPCFHISTLEHPDPARGPNRGRRRRAQLPTHIPHFHGEVALSHSLSRNRSHPDRSGKVNQRDRIGPMDGRVPMPKLVCTGSSSTKNDVQALNVTNRYSNPRENRFLGGLGFRTVIRPCSGQIAP